MQGRALRQAGTAIVEFTIVLPVLLFLMLATAEVGRLLAHYNTLTKSVRDASRYAAARAAVGTTRLINITPQLLTETRNLAVTGNTAGSGSPVVDGLEAGDVTVSDAGGGYVSVSVTHVYSPMLGAVLPGFGLGSPTSMAVPLSATVVMRAL